MAKTKTLTKRLLAVAETPVAPAWMTSAVAGDSNREAPGDYDAAAGALAAEAERVASARLGLLAIPPAGPRRRVVLL